MTNLSIAWTGGGSYVVYSPTEDGDSNAYNVDLDGPTCNCEHGEHQREDATEACKHIREAVKSHMSHPDLEHSTLLEWAGIIRDSSATLRDAEAALQSADEANVAARETEAAAVQDANSGASDAEVNGSVSDAEPNGQAASEAAERLQDAFDDVLDDMQVKAHAGTVWFQTGQDTEDEWPYPGSFDGPDFMSEVERAVTSPDIVQYVHDGSQDWADSPHPMYDDKPGDWWKNALEPGDVDQYISEVLE